MEHAPRPSETTAVSDPTFRRSGGAGNPAGVTGWPGYTGTQSGVVLEANLRASEGVAPALARDFRDFRPMDPRDS